MATILRVGADPQADARRLKLALDLFATGEEMMRQRLRRENPRSTDAQIEGLLRQWLQERPGAPFGDSSGTPVSWPRRAH
jgi:hypothetical protein